MKKASIIIFLSIIIILKSFGQCEENLHTPFFQDAWLSCELSQNPNDIRPASHWVQFDFGYPYTIDTVFIWNYNFWGYEDIGARLLAIDYSLDGSLWKDAGTFEIEKASGSHKYQGTIGAILDNLDARYILLTVVESYDLEIPCAGLSEVKFSLSAKTTSVKENGMIPERLITLSPNPASSQMRLTINANEVPGSVMITDVNGRLIEEVVIAQPKNIQINVSHLIEGIYFVKIAFKNQIVSKRFVKVH